MKTKMKTKLGWLAAAALLGAWTVEAQAAATPTAQLNINVTITSNLSVKVDTVETSSQSVTWGGASSIVAQATATVTNDSAYMASNWRLTTAASSFDPATGAVGWTIGATGGVDTVAVQATFGATGLAAAGCSGATWADANVAPTLTTTPVTYTQSVLSDTALGGVGARPTNSGTDKMNAGNSRPLCWKLTMPTSTAITANQVVPIVVTAF